MMNRLVVPLAFASRRIECQNAIAKEVHAFAITPVKIKRRRTGRGKHPAAFFIDRQATPGIGTTVALAFDKFPGIVSILSLLRNRMKNPFELTGNRIVGADVTGRGIVSFRNP